MNNKSQMQFIIVLVAALLVLIFLPFSVGITAFFLTKNLFVLLGAFLVVIGAFSILGKVFGVEVDSLFVTAVLTIIGFSVHDTIVVFDRVRENLKKMIGRDFAQVVNESILQTMRRSINTSLTVVLVLVSLLIFGGETIRWFVVALLVGIISGTYSSIFNASPLLVVWHEWKKRG